MTYDCMEIDLAKTIKKIEQVDYLLDRMTFDYPPEFNGKFRRKELEDLKYNLIIKAAEKFIESGRAKEPL